MTAPSAPHPWILRAPDAQSAALRLLCLPHAGSGAAVFGGWAQVLGAAVQVVPLQPPGREHRLAEPPHTDMATLIAELTAVVVPLCDAPYALYGHSMGAFVAFELAHALQRAGHALPALLVASGARSPHLPVLRPLLCELADDDLLAAIEQRYGVRFEPDMLELVRLTLPTLRADLSVVETREPRPPSPLPVPLLVLCGAADPGVPLGDARAWERNTTESFEFKVFPGGHFFQATQRDAVLHCIGRALAARRWGRA